MAKKYYLDQEFIEGYQKPIKWLPTIGNFNRPVWTIQLISIAIRVDDGRTYYAISNEFNPDDASQWVKDNVISKLPPRKIISDELPVEPDNNPVLISNPVYKSNAKIAKEVFCVLNGHSEYESHRSIDEIQRQFIKELMTNPHDPDALINWMQEHNALSIKTTDEKKSQVEDYMYYAQPEIYGYYGDYDWVLFCSLYGTMMDLPKGYPMYLRDTKQMLDEVATEVTDRYFASIKNEPNVQFNRSYDEMWQLNLKALKYMKDFPVIAPENEHDARYDAEFIFALHNFIKRYKPSI